MKEVFKKIHEQVGESLIETLAAMLITCLGLTLLPGAIISAARVNKRAKDAYVVMATKTSQEESEQNPIGSPSLSLMSGDTQVDLFTVDMYKDQGNNENDVFYYYRYHPAETTVDESDDKITP